ncbi:hypothetical protein HPP92_006569 [Vanilla planifolia]|uniref:Tubby C-terminal domain-containing protein n=1 Tax=Vanilla planifolia TaxID=51239 RepID=A0A835V785_VANPL|nr:hypothetical protein HPP92_006828 [Vanilla planifolia]KAG0489706.1 hypothetical protein HPP92_006569 [Vanilla planifolia]
MDRSMDFSSTRFFDLSGAILGDHRTEAIKVGSHWCYGTKSTEMARAMQCWCPKLLCGRVTVASVKNFQLIAAKPTGGSRSPNCRLNLNQPNRIGTRSFSVWKGCEDMFTMDYRYPPFSLPGFRHMPEQLRHRSLVNSGSQRKYTTMVRAAISLGQVACCSRAFAGTGAKSGRSGYGSQPQSATVGRADEPATRRWSAGLSDPGRSNLIGSSGGRGE